MVKEDEIKDELRGRIRFYRKKNNFSIKELAEKSGVTEKTIQRIENFKYEFTPSLSTLIALVNVFDISLSQLFELL